MSLKETIISWNNGVEAAIAGNLDEAVTEWMSMSEPGAKIYYNIASMRLKQGQIDQAIRNLDTSVKKDPHLALAFFQRGCLYLQKKKYETALSDFDKAITKLRGNPFIDYKQLGLQYKLYACEVMFNQAFALTKLGRTAEAMDELHKAKSKSATTSESRHKIISPALDNMMNGKTGFQAYELPDRALVFQPPRNKTEVLKPVTFIASSRVLASVVDQDSYTGFVGVQDKAKSGTPSPLPSPVAKPRGIQKPDRPPKPDKPDVPPPKNTGFSVPGRNSSLHGEEARPNLSKSVNDEFRKVMVTKGGREASATPSRPPVPDVAPPPFVPEGNARRTPKPKTPVKQKSNESLMPSKKSKSPLPRSPSPGVTGNQMTVKVHYSSTRALRISSTVRFTDLDKAICKKFGNPSGSLTFYSKKRNGELLEVNDDSTLKELTSILEDGFRLTLWAYDKHESSPEAEEAAIKMVIARFAYTPQYDDELGFSAGDHIDVTVDINDDWYEGRVNGITGIFPKSYVKDA